MYQQHVRKIFLACFMVSILICCLTASSESPDALASSACLSASDTANSVMPPNA
jgi:hypothetical protein